MIMAYRWSLLLFQLLLTLCVTLCQAQSGLRVAVTEKTLKEINTMEIQELQQDLQGKRFDDINGNDGDLEYRLSNIQIIQLGSLNANVDLKTNAVSWNGYLSHISARADWWVKYEVDALISFDVKDDGSVTLDVGQTSVSISVVPSVSNGALSISLGHCHASVGHLEPHFGGGLLAKILDLIKRIFINKMKSKLEDSLCQAVRRTLEKVSEDMKTVDTSFETELLGIKVAIDNSFKAMEVSETSIVTYHQGSLAWDDRPLLSDRTAVTFPPAGEFGLCFDLRTDVVNDFLKQAAASRTLDGNMTYLTENEENRKFFLLSCGDWDLCFGNVFRQVSKSYPGRYVGLYWSITDAGIVSESTGITGTVSGKLDIRADSGEDSDQLFSSSFAVKIPIQLKFSGSHIGARVYGIGGSITIDKSMVGKVLTDETRMLLNGLMKGMKSTVLGRFNSHTTRYDIKLPRQMTVKNSKLTLFPDLLRAEAEVCYKRHCPYEGTGDWIGTSNLADDVSIDIADITSEESNAAKQKKDGHTEL